MIIEIEQSDTKGTAHFTQQRKRLAGTTYSITSPQLIIIDHIAVDESLESQEVGKKLLFDMLEKTGKESFKIFPLYPFANSVFDKEKSIKDVLK